jgi:alpha-methylacyl-CoA racemase
MAGIGPVPWAAMMLADLGAEVIRVDRPEEGPLAGLSRMDPTGRGRKSLRLDLKQSQAREVMERLVARSAVLIEGFRPGVMERLGLGPDFCLGVNPSLVYGRMTGWGQSGPLAPTAGHDITYLAVTGTLSAIGTPDQPLPPLNFIADYGGGAMLLLVGVLAALDHSTRTGEGQVVDAAMVDGVALLGAMIRGGLAAGWWREGRQRNLLDGGAPFYRTYRTADDQFVAVGALEPQFYRRLLEGLGLAGADLPPQHDQEGWPELAARFEAVFAGRPLAHWVEVFSGSDACVAPVHTLAEALTDPHLRARSTFLESGGISQPAPAPRFSVTPPSTDGVPVPAGAHTRQVLDLLGYSEGEIIKLLAERTAS